VLEEQLAPAQLTVTSPNDDGSAGTLRAALATANTDAANGISDTINFASTLAGATIALTPGLGPLELSGAGDGTITIDGSGLGGTVTISGGHATGVFKVDANVNAVLDGLTVTAGTGGNPVYYGPASIENYGVLKVITCTVSGNDENGIFNAPGGDLTVSWGSSISDNTSGYGIANRGTLTVRDSTFSRNQVGIWNARFSTTDPTVTISGSTISYNQVNGIRSGSSMAISGSTIADNGLNWTATPGSSGIYQIAGPLTVSGCTVADNGGPGIRGAAVTVLASTVSGNNRNLVSSGGEDFQAPLGGIMFNTGTVLGSILSGNFGAGIVSGFNSSISGCSVSNNTGAGIVMPWDNTTVSGCIVTGNGTNPGLAPHSGSGGIVNQGIGSSVTDCTISGNSSQFVDYPVWSGSGGGIFNAPHPLGEQGTLTVSGCTISGNSADLWGGGIANFGTMDIEGCAVTGNSAAGFTGGGLWNAGYATLTIDAAQTPGGMHSVFSGNTAPSGADLKTTGP
jgi:hypothetical protein